MPLPSSILMTIPRDHMKSMTTPIRRMTLPAPVLGALLTATTCFAAAAGSNLVGDETLTVSPKDAVPPGMVVLRGGRVTMGTKPKAIEELMTNATNQGMIRVLDGETPEHSSKVGPFAIGKYEVTNEQYLVYVNASGARPPENWAGKALDEARGAFQKVEAEKAMAATKEGGSYDRKKWNEAEKNKWWLSSWQDAWIRTVGRHAPPHRGGVGLRCAWRQEVCLPVGRRVGGRGACSHQRDR